MWTLSEQWNKSLEEKEEREVIPRDYIWASELGKSPIDVWLRMKGVKPTNLPNNRSKRKFEAGNVWEWIVELVLRRAGLMIENQTHLKHQYPGLCEVTGRVDFIAGGKPDIEKARQELEDLMLPEVFTRAFENIFQYLGKQKELEKKILEIKSLSAFMFDSVERAGNASKIHRLQCYHYLKSTGIKEGAVVYICRDDCRMMEIPVYLGGATELEYKKEIEILSGYYQRDEQPPHEKPIVFDEDLKKFVKNFKVGYSLYLTKLYGFKEPQEFDDIYIPKVSAWNRVLTRMKQGKEMTKSNLEYLGAMREVGFDPDTLLANFVEDEASETVAPSAV